MVLALLDSSLFSNDVFIQLQFSVCSWLWIPSDKPLLQPGAFELCLNSTPRDSVEQHKETPPAKSSNKKRG